MRKFVISCVIKNLPNTHKGSLNDTFHTVPDIGKILLCNIVLKCENRNSTTIFYVD